MIVNLIVNLLGDFFDGPLAVDQIDQIENLTVNLLDSFLSQVLGRPCLLPTDHQIDGAPSLSDVKEPW